MRYYRMRKKENNTINLVMLPSKVVPVHLAVVSVALIFRVLAMTISLIISLVVSVALVEVQEEEVIEQPKVMILSLK